MTDATPTGPDEPLDPDALKALMRELQSAAEQLSGHLGGLASSGREAAAAHADQVPVLSRLIDLAPPELRQRLATAATSGLSATRDLADWVLTQLTPQPERVQPQELEITPLPAPKVVRVPTTWILTASVDNHRATESTGFSVIGIKERNRKRAFELEPGDIIVLYLTKVMSFAGAVRVTGDVYEDRAKLWPGKPGSPDAYPWRMTTEPIIVLPQPAWIPAAEVQAGLEHVQKWPAEHWKLAFQGQLRIVSEHDSELLLDALRAASKGAK